MLLHMLYLSHSHACNCKIRHTRMHAWHSLPHMQAHSCMRSHILLHMLYVPHMHEYICIVYHTCMHVVEYSAHRLYQPHRHEYICIIYHKGMHAVAYSATQAVSATQACMQAHNLPHMHARSTLSATLARMQRHKLPHMQLHNQPHSALLLVCATQACMQQHNPPHRHACSCIICHAGMHTLHYLPHRHACSCIICHTCGCIIYHTGMHAGHVVAYFARHEYMCIMSHTKMRAVANAATQAVSTTQAWIHSHNLSDMYARCRIFCYTSCIYYIGMHAVLTLPHKHAYGCIMCHIYMHTIA